MIERSPQQSIGERFVSFPQPFPQVGRSQMQMRPAALHLVNAALHVLTIHLSNLNLPNVPFAYTNCLLADH